MNIPNGGNINEPHFNVNVTSGISGIGMQAEIDILKESVV